MQEYYFVDKLNFKIGAGVKVEFKYARKTNIWSQLLSVSDSFAVCFQGYWTHLFV